MKYEKPEVTLIAQAIEAVQGCTMKPIDPTDGAGLSAGAYQSDE